MYGINGKPIIELDDLIDARGLHNLEDSINQGLAKSNWDIASFGPGVYDKDMERDLFWLERGTYLHSAPFKKHPDADSVAAATAGMTVNQRRTYLKLRYGVFTGGHTLYLRKPKSNDYMRLDDANDCYWTPDSDNFADLRAWIKYSLPMASLGRVIFFINEHKCPGVEHSDYYNSKVARGYVADKPHAHEFIWLTPDKTGKSFYVLDEANGQRHYVKGHSAWFNSFDVHGSDASDRMTWSLRIDGTFNNELRNRILTA